MSVVLYHNEKLIGLFDNIDLCSNFVKSIEINNWATGFKAIKYKSNSCVKEWERELKFYEVTIKHSENTKHSNDSIESSSTNSKIDTNGFNSIESIDTKDLPVKKEPKCSKQSKEIVKKEQIDQYKYNLLKVQREKILESKNKYEVDLSLYNRFKSEVSENDEFQIPEAFEEKYLLFKKLDDENEITWDNYALMYKEKDFNGRFSNIFEVSNEFDNKFFSNINVESSDSSSGSDDSESEIEESSVDNDSSGEEIFEISSDDDSD